MSNSPTITLPTPGLPQGYDPNTGAVPANAAAPAAPSPIVTTAGQKTVQMVNPDGEVGGVPAERASEAATHGYKPVIRMTNPDGEDGWVPADASHKALAQGYKFTEATAAPDRGIAENLVGGVMEGASKTVQGGANLLAKGAEHVLGMPPGSLQAGRTETENPALARSVGNIAEEAGEWIMGDAAFKAIPYVQRLEMAQKVAATADESPIVARLLHAGLSVFRGGTVGAAEGGVKGAATGEAAKGAEIGAATGAAGGAAESVIPSVIRKVNPWASAKAARSAVDEAAEAAARDSGVTGGTAPSEGGIRTALDDHIKQVAGQERATYDRLNDVTGTDYKDLFDKREQLQTALDDPTTPNTNELQDRLKFVQDQIDVAEKNARNAKNPADVDKLLAEAKAQTQQRYAIEEMKKRVFNNESVVSGDLAAGSKDEKININAAIKAVQNLDKPSKFAPEGSPTRLAQALGKDGAAQFKRALYKAQKQGEVWTAVAPYLKWMARGAAATLAGEGIYKVTKH